MMQIVSVGKPRRYPPRVTRFTEPFWNGLIAGEFLTTRCAACRQLTFPPKPICPNCWHAVVAWEAQPIGGVLYSWTRIYAGPAVFEPDLPYEVGIVDLDAGLRIGCPLVGRTVDWQCGMRVQLAALSYVDGPFFGAQVELGAAEDAVD